MELGEARCRCDNVEICRNGTLGLWIFGVMPLACRHGIIEL